MKLHRLGAVGCSLALALSLTAVPARAATFPDLVNADGTTHWATPFIEDLYARGYAAGSTDGNFYPDRNMTATEALLFCARVTGVDEDTRKEIFARRGEEVAGLLPTLNATNVWAAPEMSVAVETGVVTPEELTALGEVDPDSGDARLTWLSSPVNREQVCRYMVRAMQLEPIARSISPEECMDYLSSHYADADQIDPQLRPYVYVLTFYKVFSGLDNPQGIRIADPKGSLRRGQMTALMSQALKVMKDLGVEAELSEYTDYPWISGVITGVTTDLSGAARVTLESSLSGVHECVIPAGTPIFDSNLGADATFLKTGLFLRVNLTSDGQVSSARLSGGLTAFEGEVTAYSASSVTIAGEAGSRTFPIDRFTEVMAGTDVGGREVIDPEAGYGHAVCGVDSLGRTVSLRLLGGTAPVRGLIAALAPQSDGSARLTLSFPDGASAVYTLPADAVITSDGSVSSLTADHVGCAVSLRVDRDSALAVSAAVDTTALYRQGLVTSARQTDEGLILTLSDSLGEEQEVTLPVSTQATVTYDGQPSSPDQIAADWFITARLEEGVIVELEGHTARFTLSGTLSSIVYGATTTLILTLPDGGEASIPISVSLLPEVVRSGEAGTIFHLRTGDSLTVTVLCRQVTHIEAAPCPPDLTGVVTAFSAGPDGYTLTLTLPDGSSATFSAGAGVSVTKNGDPASFREVNRGDTVALVTKGDRALSVDITAVAPPADKLTGQVLLTTNLGSTRSITLLADGRPEPVTVNVRNARLMDRTGDAIFLSSLKAEDTVEIYGAFQEQVFVATLVIKQ